jgi:hypothetical protein
MKAHLYDIQEAEMISLSTPSPRRHLRTKFLLQIMIILVAIIALIFQISALIMLSADLI